MRFCRVNTTPPVLVIRRDEAELLASDAGVDWEYEEVPTGKVELRDFINTAVEAAYEDGRKAMRPMGFPDVLRGIGQLTAGQLADVAHSMGRRINWLANN